MTRDEVVAALKREEASIRRFGVTALYLFGSAARDELGPDSDIDMFIEYDPTSPPDLIDMSRLDRHLAGVLNRRVDLGTRDGLHPRLRDEIERTSIRAV